MEAHNEKKFITFINLFIDIYFIFRSSNISFADNEPSIVAKHAVLMDYESGKILYNKDGNSKLYPASTTKVWTACLVLKEVKDLNQVIEIKIYLK